MLARGCRNRQEAKPRPVETPIPGTARASSRTTPIQNPEMYKIRNRIEWSAGMVGLEPRAGVKRNGDRFTLSLGRLGGCGVPGVRNVLRPPSSRTFRATHHALPRAVLNLIRCDRHPLAIYFQSGGRKHRKRDRKGKGNRKYNQRTQKNTVRSVAPRTRVPGGGA